MRILGRAFSALTFLQRRRAAPALTLALSALMLPAFALADDIPKPHHEGFGGGGLVPGLAIGVGTAIGAGIAAGATHEDVVGPEFCYTYKFGANITCKKRSARGQTCKSYCDLVEDGVDRGPTPPAKLFTAGSKYECQCQDPE